jgi:hypothetical protein
LALSGCAAGMVASLAYVPRPYSYILTGLAFLVMLVILGSLVPDNLPTAYSVAVIGFRRSGKTTLLTEIFHELIHFRISDVDASLRGQATIERLTDYIGRIDRRQPVGSTTEESRFPYEANVEVRSGIFLRKFKVSIADYPGESSEQLSRRAEMADELRDGGISKTSLLGNQEYFRWVLEADAMIFIIDIAAYLLDRLPTEADGPEGSGDNARYMTNSFTMAWQYLLDARRQGGSERLPRVVLAFTKCDLLDMSAETAAADSLEAVIARLGYEAPLPEVRELNPLTFAEKREKCESDFADLIEYFKHYRGAKFSVVFTSSLTLLDGKRVGIEELFRGILPR